MGIIILKLFFFYNINLELIKTTAKIDFEVLKLNDKITELKEQLDEHLVRLDHQATLYDRVTKIERLLSEFFDKQGHKYYSKKLKE